MPTPKKSKPKRKPNNPVLVPRASKVPAQDSEFLTTAQGVRLSHTDDSLKAGRRGPTLMDDFGARIEQNKQRVG